MAGKTTQFWGERRNLPELISCLAETAEKPDLSHPNVMASGTKPLVKVRYAAGAQKHLATLPLARARPQQQKGCFGLKRLCFSSTCVLKILAVFHANLACGHCYAYTEGPRKP